MISVHDLVSFNLITTVNRTKGATLFAVDCKVSQTFITVLYNNTVNIYQVYNVDQEYSQLFTCCVSGVGIGEGVQGGGDFTDSRK